MRKIFLSLLSAALILGSTQARAERPAENAAPESSNASTDTFIDKSIYIPSSAYENPPPETELIKIGLSYGDAAEPEVQLENLSGGGFIIGSYDAERQFHPAASTELNKIGVGIISSGGSWRILPDGAYETKSEASGAAEELGAEVFEEDGLYRLFLGSYNSKTEADKARKALKLEGRSFYDGSGRLYLYNSLNGSLIYETDEGVSALAIIPANEGSLTSFRGDSYRGGFECRMHDAGHLSIINYVGLEDYIKGVIPYEMSWAWPIEALKAQAVCARTYAVYNLNRFKEYGFDLTADTYSQVYRGTGESNHISDSAVDDTAGELIRYRGQVCEVYYCSSNGGATEDGINVFGTEAPYLAGKTDPFENALDYPLKSWSFTKTPQQIMELLRERDYEIESISRIEAEYSDTGNVLALKYYDNSGKCLEIRGRSCYTSLGLHSCRFRISEDEGAYVFTGTGWGHSCGMSQWGAHAMASVYGYNYEDILRFYFSGAYIA